MTETERTLSQLRRAIAQTGNPDDRRISEAMMLLIVAAAWGTNIANLVRTGLPLDFIVGIATRMRAAGLWSNEGIDTRGWWDEHNELIGHVLFRHALLGLGE